jgi:hypothetical protein
MEKAALVISVYNRAEHFKQCIDSLRENPLAAETPLYVAIDAPIREEHREDNRKVIEFAKTIQGFSKVNLFIREENYGSKKNIRKAFEDVFKTHERLIFTEDDNIFSEDFLSFVNTALETYREREDIFAVSGYNYPVQMPASYKEDVYIWPGYTAWGVGLWREKWMRVNWDRDVAMGEVKETLKSYRECIKINRLANHYVENLMTMAREDLLHGDGYLSLYIYLNKMYSVFPSVSRVRNAGHDGSGLHCDDLEDDIYKRQAIYGGPPITGLPGQIRPSKAVYRTLRNHFRISIRSLARNAYNLYKLNKTLK